MVINAVKDVAAALGELINATKLASGKPIHDPAMQELKESARVSALLFVQQHKNVIAPFRNAPCVRPSVECSNR